MTTYILLYINIKMTDMLSHILLVMHDRYFIFNSLGGGGLRLPLSICLSIRPSVYHTLRYRVWVINSSQSYNGIFETLYT